MTASLRNHVVVTVALLTVVGVASSCAGDVEQHNFESVITSVGPTYWEDRALMIDYTIRDPEGDDQRIEVGICEASETDADSCPTAVQGIGGDGTHPVPTVPRGESVSHRFAWDAGCGRVDDDSCLESDVSTEYVARVRIAGKDEYVESDAFVLGDDFGLEETPQCRVDADSLPEACQD